MHWFFVALAAPLIWSLVNHIDKFLLSRYFHGGGAGGLMIFIAVTAFPIAGLIALFNPAVLTSVSLEDMWLLIASGIFYNIAVYLYMVALEKADASHVVPFWQLTPVFAYVFGILFLGELLSTDKLVGGAIVLLGAFFLSLDVAKKGKVAIHTRTVLVMLLSSALLALGYILFKDAEIVVSSFWTSMFWNQIGMLFFGIVFFLIPSFRSEFLKVIKENSSAVLGLNIFEQLLEVLGIVANNFAILLAPIALVVLIEYTFQPLFVFALGVFLTLLAPAFVKEDLRKRVLAQKFLAILIMGAGLLLVV
jgi:drug/metabolite transporter (DMT)-like permease